MSNELVLSSPVSVAVAKEIDGLEMGVLSDGRAYLTGRALARLCGVAISTIINQGDRWLQNERSNKLAQLLVRQGLERPSLFEVVKTGQMVAGKDEIHAWPDDVCTAVLEYYAFDATPPSPQAQSNFRRLAQASLKLIVYRAVGYDPQNQIPAAWKQFHARLTTHAVPHGFFSVFRELAEFMVVCIQRGLPCDAHTVPDISVGQIWAKHWVKQGLDERFGPRKKHEHNYPDDFPQSASNPQDIWIYPLAAVPEFRNWLMAVYVPEKFPAYLKGQIAKGTLPASTVELLIEELAAPQLTEGKPSAPPSAP